MGANGLKIKGQIELIKMQGFFNRAYIKQYLKTVKTCLLDCVEV